ncbi:MAG TPA: tryptophan--tRNA ligase [Chitinophagales bacterium]|nr:tryptophan--tRNA ligase [Chitinophagales bacterium]
MEIVVSGIRPTGVLHLGNYYGAVRNFVRMQEDENYKGYFFIADYHSLTTHHHPEELSILVKQSIATYLACGLDPERVTLYLQSDLPQIPELYLILNMIAYKGELEKVVTFKEKIKIHNENINAGLLTYPVLMAADILIHRAHKVPVGKDQEQHLEMTRNFAKRFNSKYNSEFFPEPMAYNFEEQLTKVPGLDGSTKMSKTGSANSAIFLNDTDDEIRKKIMRAKTDAGPTEPFQVMPQEIMNLFELMKIVSSISTVMNFTDAYNNCNIKYGDMKKQLAEDIIEVVAPIRKRINELLADEKYLKKVVILGGEAAIVNAEYTINEVRKLVGLNYF